MTAVSKNGATLQVVTEGNVIANYRILRGRLKVDQGNSPHIEGEIVVPKPDAATLPLLDPRSSPQCIVYPTEDGWLSGAFVLALRSLRIDGGEVVLGVASFESLLLDYAPLADDYAPLDLAGSLRAIVNYVLGVAKPSVVVLPWTLSASPAIDADMTPYWELTNLATNPSFELNANDTAISSNASSGSSQPLFSPLPIGGTRAVRFSVPTAGVSRFYPAGYSTIGAGFRSMRVSPGKTYTASLYAVGSIPRSSRIGLHFRDEGGNILEGEWSPLAVDGGGSTMVRYHVTAIAPRNAAVASIIFESNGNTAGQFHFIDGVMLTEGDLLVDYFDGDTALAGYATHWTGDAHATASIRVPDPALARSPESLIWKAGQPALDFLLPLVQSAGYRLVNDGSWTLRDETYRASGFTTIEAGVNMVTGTDSIDREARLWYDAQVTRYTWTDIDGIQREAIDAYALDPDDYRLVNVEEKSQPYPGPGYSEYSVRRAQERGHDVVVTAMTSWDTTAEQPITITLDDGIEQHGVIQSVEFDLELDEMTVTVRPDGGTP